MLLITPIQVSATTHISPCSADEYTKVLECIENFELDNRQLSPNDFLTIHHNGHFAGFGRIRQYQGFSEMCSTGILEGERNQGLGTLLLETMARLAPKPVYLVCIIPQFFTRIGFEICQSYPVEIKEKLDYCTNGLPVEETYVVMSKLK